MDINSVLVEADMLGKFYSMSVEELKSEIAKLKRAFDEWDNETTKHRLTKRELDQLLSEYIDQKTTLFIANSILKLKKSKNYSPTRSRISDAAFQTYYMELFKSKGKAWKKRLASLFQIFENYDDDLNEHLDAVLKQILPDGRYEKKSGNKKYRLLIEAKQCIEIIIHSHLHYYLRGRALALEIADKSEKEVVSCLKRTVKTLVKHKKLRQQDANKVLKAFELAWESSLNEALENTGKNLSENLAIQLKELGVDGTVDKKTRMKLAKKNITGYGSITDALSKLRKEK